MVSSPVLGSIFRAGSIAHLPAHSLSSLEVLAPWEGVSGGVVWWQRHSAALSPGEPDGQLPGTTQALVGLTHEHRLPHTALLPLLPGRCCFLVLRYLAVSGGLWGHRLWVGERPVFPVPVWVWRGGACRVSPGGSMEVAFVRGREGAGWRGCCTEVLAPFPG